MWSNGTSFTAPFTAPFTASGGFGGAAERASVAITAPAIAVTAIAAPIWAWRRCMAVQNAMAAVPAPLATSTGNFFSLSAFFSFLANTLRT